MNIKKSNLLIDKHLSIGTLGPKGTSSEAAGNYYIKKFLIPRQVAELKLFESFDKVFSALLDREITWALVPHAYAYINKFYINPLLKLKRIFIFDTPAYGLVKKANVALPSRKCLIVTHPAPILLIDPLLKKYGGITNYEIELVLSTSIAAQRVQEGSADLAITNEIAANKFGLEWLSSYGPIRMGWSIFSHQ